jgi:hypothetical protein
MLGILPDELKKTVINGILIENKSIGAVLYRLGLLGNQVEYGVV